MEIVIENPVESPPPPPPPPPPQPQISWNSIVPSTTSSPAATTVMTITIAENPTAPTYPPVRFSYRETYAVNSLPYPGRRGQPRGRSYDDPEVMSPSVRRVDKSGLLGITEPEVSSGLRASLRSPRFLSASSSQGMVSPRRFECIGQLDPVPEIPGQPSGIPQVTWTPSLMHGQERREKLESREALTVMNLGRPTKSASFDSLESRLRGAETLQNLEGIEPSRLNPSSSFRFQEGLEARVRPLGRLPRCPLGVENSLEGVPKYSETCCNFPFTVRSAAAAGFQNFEGSSSLPSTRATTTAVTTSTTTAMVSTMNDTETMAREKHEVQGSPVPEEERAEAEGCEHSSSKDGEPSQRDILDNDAIQTLRVIILSEQL